jgi:hypothetical protein
MPIQRNKDQGLTQFDPVEGGCPRPLAAAGPKAKSYQRAVMGVVGGILSAMSTMRVSALETMR